VWLVTVKRAGQNDLNTFIVSFERAQNTSASAVSCIFNCLKKCFNSVTVHLVTSENFLIEFGPEVA
jgi:hypothetical protein